MNLADSVILLTGAGGAIGRSLARELVPACKQFIAVDMSDQALEQLRAELPDVTCHRCDLSDAAAVEAMVVELPPVSVLINNAGLIHSEPLVNLLSRGDKKHDFAAWRRVLDANLNATFYTGACIAESMVARRCKGVIVNISSIAAAGNVGQSAYAAAKAGVEALTVTWAKELGMFGIRVAAIAPGFLDTTSTHAALNDATLDKWKAATPLRRLGAVGDLAVAIRFVIENDFFTGRVLGLDGGLRI